MRGIADKAGWRYVPQFICITSLNLRTAVWQLALFGRVRLFTCNHASMLALTHSMSEALLPSQLVSLHFS